MTYVRIELDDNLHAKFKSKCALEQVDMQVKLVNLIDDFVKKR